MVSNVEFKSNLYPLKDYFIYDHEFLSQIHDVFALEKLRNNSRFSNFEMSELQKAEFENGAVKCSYARPDDYVWGTIIDPSSGKERVVCKCINQNCKYFSKCRKDFNPAELKVIEENKKHHSAIRKIFEPEKIDTTKIQAAEIKIDEPVKPAEDEKIDNETTKTPEIETVKPVEAEHINAEIIQGTDTETESEDKNTPAETIQGAEIKTDEPTENNFSSFVKVTQEKIIESAPDERIIVNGGPGTGKTWTLIQKIVYLIEEQEVPAENILVFCFSRAAVEVVRMRMAEIAKDDYQDVDIRTFDSFATYLLAFAKKDLPELLPPNYRLEVQNYNERIAQAVSVLKADRDILNNYAGGHIIVDEVQDLVGVRAELVIELLKIIPEDCGFTLFGDSCQSLYDYLSLNDTTVMSSEDFYSNIFQGFPKLKCYSLTVNHRQSSNFEKLINPYREKILGGNVAECFAIFDEKVKANISPLEIKLKKFTEESAKKYSGTIGILTRTNGQALQISSWLKNNEVSHNLQRNSKSNFGDWIAKIFCGYENSTISESDFIKRHLQVYPNLSKEIAQKRWNALVNTQKGIARQVRHYEVEDLLKGVMNNAKDNILFESGDHKEELITVSNIHRAKGKEFDSVILIKEIVDFQSNDVDILEHKVCYVGLTRAKKVINIAETSMAYNYIIQNENRRCFQATLNRRTSKFFLSSFEIGITGDVDNFSCCTDEIQNFIAKDLQSFSSIKLKKCHEGTRKYVTYEIVVEEPKYLILGYTDKIFAEELTQALRKILNLTDNLDVYYSIYPNEFDNVYINEIITCISSANKELPAAKNFGDMKIWHGFSIVGFAKVVNDRH